MRYSALLLAIVICCVVSPEIAAQRSPESAFSLGIAPFSLLLPSGKANLRGEWAYSGNKSLALQISVPRPTPAPGFVANNFDLNGKSETTTNRFTSFGAILEHRFYLGQNAMRGFYLAPYARYNNFSLTRTSQNADNQFNTRIKGSLGGFGVGAAAGVQFRLGDFITLDATIAGLDMKWMRGTVTYSTDNPEVDLAAFRDEVQEVVGDIPFIGSKLLADIEGNAVKVHAPGVPMPGYRFNLTLNFVF